MEEMHNNSLDLDNLNSENEMSSFEETSAIEDDEDFIEAAWVRHF